MLAALVHQELMMRQVAEVEQGQLAATLLLVWAV
jgi:hypothetical protein